jgi:hypothetical protein
MQDNTVIASVLSENFVAGFVVMERTLREQNPGWDMPVVIIQSHEAPLSDFAKGLIREHCQNVHFATANPARLAPTLRFARDVIGTPPRLWPAFSILEAISWSGFDRVITLDSDMVILGSLAPLLATRAPFSAVRARNSRTDAPAGFFNTGVMVFNRAMLLGFDVEKIPDYIGSRRPRPGTGLADQAVLNMLVHNRHVGWLPERFNTTKRSVGARLGLPLPEAPEVAAWLLREDIRVLHYVGEKPWDRKVRAREEDYASVEAVWHETAERIGGKTLFQHMQRCDRHWGARYTKAFQEVSRGGKKLSQDAMEKRVARAMGM